MKSFQEEEFDIPEVSYDSLEVFEDFLNGSVNSGTELTGRESLGYFSWEERFEFQGKVGSKAEQARSADGQNRPASQ